MGTFFLGHPVVLIKLYRNFVLDFLRSTSIFNVIYLLLFYSPCTYILLYINFVIIRSILYIQCTQYDCSPWSFRALLCSKYIKNTWLVQTRGRPSSCKLLLNLTTILNSYYVFVLKFAMDRNFKVTSLWVSSPSLGFILHASHSILSPEV